MFDEIYILFHFNIILKDNYTYKIVVFDEVYIYIYIYILFHFNIILKHNYTYKTVVFDEVYTFILILY